VTETTTVITETVRGEAIFDLTVGEEAEREDEVPVPEQQDQRGEVDEELIQLSRSVMLPDDPAADVDAEDALDAQGESGDYQEQVDEAMPTSDEVADDGEEAADDGDAASEDGELLSEEESEGEEGEEGEEDVGEVEDDDDSREDEGDEDGPPSIRSKIWDFLTT